MIKNLFFIASILLSCTVSAQLTDLARVEYTYFPQSDSDNSFRRFRTFVNVPLKVSESAYLVPGLEYRNVNLKFKDETPFNREDLTRYQSFSLSLGYTFKLNEKWRFGARAAAIATSNFSTDSFTTDDLLYTGAVYFINDQTDKGLAKPWRLILGGRYDTESGRPFPLPFVNYYREFHADWSFTLGVPKSNVKRYFGPDQKHIVQAFVTLDGFYANIQDNVAVRTGINEIDTAESISMTVLLGGLGYEFCFTEHLVFYIYTGHTILNDIRLRDGSQEDVFTVNENNSFYGRTGIKFKI